MSQQQPGAKAPAEPEPAEVDGLLAAVRQRYPALDDEAAATVRSVLAQHRRMIQGLRRYPLTNADEPDVAFTAHARE